MAIDNPSNLMPDQEIIIEGDAGFVPKASPSDAGKVLGVLNSSGDVGWVVDQSGTFIQVQADWAQTDSSQPSYIDNKPDLSVYATASSVETALAGKQDVINDLATIRAGAAAGATAAQPGDLPSSDELVPSSSSGDSGKVLTVNAQGEPGWQTPASVTVDQTYNASSTNAQSGTAVAQAIAAIPAPSVDEVPAVESTDDGKVLTASYSGGTGSYSWQTAQGGGGGAAVEAGAGLVKSGDTLSVNAYRGLRIGEPMSSFSIDSSNKFFTTPYFRNMASQVKCLCSTEASTSASWYGTTTAHIVIANADNAVYGVSTVEFEAGRYYESSTYLPRALYVPITFDASNFTMNAGHTFSDLGDNYATVNVFVTLKGTTGSSETPNGEQPLYVNKAYLSTLTSLNEIFYPTTEPPAGQRSFLTANYFNGMYSPFWNVAYPKPTSADAGKVLQVQNDGTLAWVTLS